MDHLFCYLPHKKENDLNKLIKHKMSIWFLSKSAYHNIFTNISSGTKMVDIGQLLRVHPLPGPLTTDKHFE